MVGRSQCLSWALFSSLLLASEPAFAEVMDKELSVPEIWHWLAVSVGVGIAFAVLHPWLLVPSFLLGPVNALTIAWTEWHDPFVRPAILREAGPRYGVSADGAMTIAVVVYIALWFVVRKYPRYGCLWFVVRGFRKPARGGQFETKAYAKREDLVFTLAMLAITLFHAFTGYAWSWGIALSTPVVAVVLVALLIWGGFYRRNIVRTAP